MYFAVVKIIFEDDLGSGSTHDGRDLHTLVEKLRARFKVCAAAITGDAAGNSAAIAVTALASSEEKLSKTLDNLIDFCEESGFGRIASEEALLDHIDALAELSQDQ